MQIQKKTVEAGGVETVVRQRGLGTPVVLVHGNSMCGEAFEGQLKSSLASQARLLAFDLPGHGSPGAASATTDYTIPGYARVVARLVEELDLRDAVMVGHSLGGHVVIEMMRSPRVAGALIFGAPPLAGAADVPKAFLPHPAMAAAFKQDLSASEIAALAAAFSEAERGPVSRWIGETRGQARAQLGLCAQQGDFADEVAILASYDRPLAILQGEHDPLVNRAYIEALEIPTLWRGAVQTVPDAGHSPHLEQPEAFTALLQAFVQDVGRSGSR